jgi:hypothetical protein
MIKTLALLAILLPFAASAQSIHTGHDTVKNAIRDVRATVDTSTRFIGQQVHIIGRDISTIVGNLGDPIPGCVGRVCGGGI